MGVCMNYKNDTTSQLEYSKGIDLNKTDKSKECKICYYNYFNNDFKSDVKLVMIVTGE